MTVSSVDPTSSVLLFAACVVGGLGVVLALPRRGVSPQLIGALVASLGLGLLYMWLAKRMPAGEKLPNPNFYLFGLVALGSALRVISHQRPVYAALWFIMTILASSGLYVLLSAEFMAFALVIVYAGAILITYLFVIMLATESPTADQVETLSVYDRYSREPVLATVFGFALVAALTPMLARGTAELSQPTTYAGASRVEFLPGKIERSLREVGLLSSDERIATGQDSMGLESIDVNPKTGEVESVAIAYGQGKIRRLGKDDPKWPTDLTLTNVEGVGFTLLADHPGAIEVAGVVLLMAMLGAVVLARKKVELDDREKLAAQNRLLAQEFTPEHSPLMAPEVPGSPSVRQVASGDEQEKVGGRVLLGSGGRA